MNRRNFIKVGLSATGGFFLLPALEGCFPANNSTATDDMMSWYGRVMYFLMIDRFNDGNPANNDQGAGEYNATDGNKFQGGDLQGIIKKLPYIKEMGFDALWITPPIYNQWIAYENGVTGYHGYWAYDFKKIDPHFGTIEDFKQLVAEAHKLDIKIIQDIVLNHTGDFFFVDANGYQPDKPEATWKPNMLAFPPKGDVKAPADSLLSMNNPNIEAHRKAGVYNFTPYIENYKDRNQVLNYSMAGLDDLNLNNPAVARYLLDVYKFWIEEVGVDGFRVDTVIYTPEEYYEYFMYSTKPDETGIKAYAKEKGINDFFIFGELWSTNFGDLNRYIEDNGKKRLDSTIDFPLFEAIAGVFAKKKPTRILTDCLTTQRKNAHLWVTFIDNHDIDRIFNTADWADIQMALLCLFTVPGIPCIYYGTEQGFKEPRKNMFDEAYYTSPTPYRDFLKQVITLRKQHKAFSHGEIKTEQSSWRSGIVSYQLTHNNTSYIVIFNTSDARMVFGFSDTLQIYKAINIETAQTTNETYSRNLIVEPNKSIVLVSSTEKDSPRKETITLNQPSVIKFADNEKTSISFSTKDLNDVSGLFVLINNNYDEKISITDAAATTFDIEGSHFYKGKNTIALLAETKQSGMFLSNSVEVEVTEYYEQITEIAVPQHSLGGLNNNLHQPTEKSYNNQVVMEKVRVENGSHFLKFTLTMKNITNMWNPVNGYDHLYLHLFFDHPDKAGKPFLPKLNYAPKNFEYNTGCVLSGWNAISFTDENATPTQYGTRKKVEILQEVSIDNKTITLYIDKRGMLGSYNATLKNTKIIVCTWDGYLDELRSVEPKTADWSFYVTDGSDVSKIAKVYHQALITL